jgi:small conductance mechanosensitive channel
MKLLNQTYHALGRLLRLTLCVFLLATTASHGQESPPPTTDQAVDSPSLQDANSNSQAAPKTTAKEPDTASIDALVKLLENDATRQKLLAQLRQNTPEAVPNAATVPPTKTPTTSPTSPTPPLGVSKPVAAKNLAPTDLPFLQDFSELIDQFSQDTVSLLLAITDIPQELTDWWRNGGDLANPSRALNEVLLWTGVFLLFYVGKFMGKRLMGPPTHYLNRDIALGLRLIPVTLGGLLWLGSFFFTSNLFVASMYVATTDKRIVLALIEALTISGVITWLRFVLAPESTLTLDTHQKNRLTNHLLDAALALLIYGTIGVKLLEIEGVGISVRRMVLSLAYLLAAGLLIAVVARTRHPVRRWIRKQALNNRIPLLKHVQFGLANLWLPLAIGILILSYTHWLFTRQEHNGWLILALGGLVVASFVLRYSWHAIDWSIHRLIHMVSRWDEGALGLTRRAQRYGLIIGMLLKSLTLMLVLISLLSALRLDSFAWLSGKTTHQLIQRLVSLSAIALIAVAIWEMVNWLLHRSIRMAAGSEGKNNPRLQTLYRLLRTVLSLALGVLLILMVLSEMGINIAPLLAGAGVIGVAIGFGAQTLVRDLLNGISLLIEDTVQLGDLVELAGQTGTVEDLTLRSLKLRDVNGCILSIPFGSITTIKNWNRDYGHQVLEVGVTHRADLRQVIPILKQVAEEISHDPNLAEQILAPADFWGVDKIDDKLMYLKLRIKTLPMARWAVARAFYERVKLAFDAAGIEMSPPTTGLSQPNAADNNQLINKDLVKKT